MLAFGSCCSMILESGSYQQPCLPSFEDEDTMQILPPTPTCTRFQVTIEMPCITCGKAMRLSLIEPRNGSNFETLTYNCAACGSEERFLMPK